MREANGMIIGYVETLSNGDTKVTDFSNRQLGGYKKNQDVTVDFGGKILFRGNMSAALIIISKYR